MAPIKPRHEAMRIAGRKVDSAERVPVHYPYSGAQIGSVPAGTAEHAREATGAGIRGMIPLQAALLSRYGAVGTACALAVGAPVAAKASKAVSVT